MKKTTIAKLAFMGLMAGGAATGCSSTPDKPDTTVPVENKATTAPTTEAVEDVTSTVEEAAPEMAYSEIHDCAGKNTCKGLGGCHVDAEKLVKLAEAAGVDADKAGEEHACAGKNACKGLGGCHVDADKLVMLKAKLAE